MTDATDSKSCSKKCYQGRFCKTRIARVGKLIPLYRCGSLSPFLIRWLRTADSGKKPSRRISKDLRNCSVCKSGNRYFLTLSFWKY